MSFEYTFHRAGVIKRVCFLPDVQPAPFCQAVLVDRREFGSPMAAPKGSRSGAEIQYSHCSMTYEVRARQTGWIQRGKAIS